MWIRYNPALKYYEYSNNNGSTWAQLPMSAASITEGSIPLPPNVAYTNINNSFSVNQSIVSSDPTLYLVDTAQAAGYRHFRLINSGQYFYIQSTDEVGNGVAYLRMSRGGHFVVADRLSVGTTVPPPNPGDLVIARNNNSNSGAIYFGSNPAGGAYLFRGTDGNYILSGGALTVNGTITVSGNVFTANGYIYPAPITSPNVVQGNWYLASHSSYGLYTNTGLYLVDYLWCLAIESRAHIRATTGLYDYARANPIGWWTAYTPYTTGSHGPWTPVTLQCAYMFIGKTCFFKYNIESSSTTTENTYLLISIPIASSVYSYHMAQCRIDFPGYGQLAGLAYIPPGGGYIYIQRPVSEGNIVAYPGGGLYVRGEIFYQID